MRLPGRKAYRMFPEFDALSDEECERLVADARMQWPWLTAWGPMAACAGFVVAWPVLVVLAWENGWGAGWVPLPGSAEWLVVVLVVTTVGGGGLVWGVGRDVGVRAGLHRLLRRSCCRRCGQSLTGLVIETVGSEPDPGKQWVRCPECGKRWNLLEVGLTARDLVPFEERGVRADFGRKRGVESWRRRW